jgi:hypothetical protein
MQRGPEFTRQHSDIEQASIVRGAGWRARILDFRISIGDLIRWPIGLSFLG